MIESIICRGRYYFRLKLVKYIPRKCSSQYLFTMVFRLFTFFPNKFSRTWNLKKKTCHLVPRRKCCKLLLCIIFIFPWSFGKQESPPAWTQEAYRPPCSEYSFCCSPGYPPRGGVPDRVPPGVRVPPGGVPDRDPTPPGGYLTRVPPRGVPDPGTPGGVRVPPRCLMAFWEMLQKHYGICVPPPVDRQNHGWTDACQNITFPHPSDAGGNNM